MTDSWAPRIDYDTAAYWEGCARGELIVARCEDCRTWIHPPRAVCPECWSDNVGRASASGDATVYSFTVTPAGRSGGGHDVVTVWAELSEQERLIVIADLEPVEPSAVVIGAPLELSWRRHGATMVPMFRLKDPA